MESEDFKTCAIRAVLAAKILREFIPVKIMYGQFIPDTDKSLWDIRWQPYDVFLHFWIASSTHIYDCAAKQFGYEQRIIAPIDDARYFALGEMDIDTQERIDYGLVFIRW